eukprot:111940_1
MAIQLTPPKKTPPKPKEKRKKKKKQLLAQKKRKQNQKIRFGSSNIGGFVGHTFDQQIDLDFDKSSDDSDEESEDETEKEAKRKEEEEKERERNMPGETDKQRIFGENRLEIIKLLCKQSKKYYNENNNENETKGLNIFNRNGINALSYAIHAQCYKNTNGYDINYGSVEIVNILIDMGCDVDIMNENAQTVISLVFEDTPTKTLEILTPILNKADVNKELIIYQEKKKKGKKGNKAKKKKKKQVNVYDIDSSSDNDESSLSDSDYSDSENMSDNKDKKKMMIMSMITEYEDEDKMDMDDDDDDNKDKKKDEKKIKIRRDSYLTTAIQELDNQMEDVKDNDEDNVMYDPIKSTKYKVIKLLIEKGAKLTIEREIPAIIQIIKQCNDDDIFEPERFQNKYVKNAGSEKNCIGYELIGLILQYAKNVDLNVVDN